MKLFIPITLNCLMVLAIYLVDKYTPAKKMPYISKQIIIGILFGGVSAFASSYGVPLLGTIVNIRDAAPLSAGLIFGAPAGLISGLIGGVYRFFSVYWGGGEFTQIACSIGTILAGVIAALLRKYVFDNKKPTWGYGICISVVCEVLHMLLIYITNMDQSSYAFDFVKGATIPMIIGNSVAVTLSILIVSIFSRERLTHRKNCERISQTFQRWLLACIVIAYIVTSVFTFVLQNGMSKILTKEVFTVAVKDVKTDVEEKSDEFLLNVAKNAAEQYENNQSIPLEKLAKDNNVVEINIVNDDGLIIDSTDSSLINNFNMKSTEQSNAFMTLTKGRRTFVQEYGPIGKDGVTMRKYAGVSLAKGGFIQIGYDTDQFHEMLDEFVIDVTKNRHVGSNGFIAVCDENLNLLTHTKRNGKHISVIGIIPNEEMKNGQSSKTICEATVINTETAFSEDFIYAFTFVEGYCLIAALPKSEAMFMRDASLYNSMFMQVLMFATLFLFIYILIKRVIINNLRKINNTLGQITRGNLEVTVDVRSNEEFASLSDDINSTVSTLKQYIADAAARIDKELEYAKQIQLSALPTNFPESEDYNIKANMIAAKEVGGDFYDFYVLNDKTVAFLVADVSGKGIPAAMFMMTAKTIIKDLAESGIPVNDILTKANEKLCENNESGMFVTAWMAIVDIETGKMYYSNAGHNPPVLKHGDGSFEFLRSRAGFVLAGMEGVKYRVNELDLLPGDRIFLYTDGVSEATDLNNNLYGEDRLLEFMNNNINEKAENLLPGLKLNIDEFVGEAPQFDDITMLMFDYKPAIGGVNVKSQTFPAKTDALNDVLGYVEETLESYDCPMKVQMALCVAIEEVFVNVAHYAYGENEGDVELTISFDESSREITFTLSDEGVPFDPLERPDPDITLSAEDREIGGLGIFITKKTMDTVSYNYENNQNVLTMIKKI